jgi:hypothetical protein
MACLLACLFSFFFFGFDFAFGFITVLLHTHLSDLLATFLPPPTAHNPKPS